MFVTDSTGKSGNWARWIGHCFVEIRRTTPRPTSQCVRCRTIYMAAGGPQREIAATQTRRFAKCPGGLRGGHAFFGSCNTSTSDKNVLNTPGGLLDLETFEVLAARKAWRPS